MLKSKRFNMIIAIFCFGAVMLLNYYYLHNVGQEIQKYSQRDEKILQDYSAEIVERLKNAESSELWQGIIDEYEYTVVVIEDSNGTDILQTTNKSFSVLDTKVQQVFAYEGEAYLIKISAYFLREYLSDSGYLFRFVLMALLIGAFLLLLFVLAVYTIMLRPVYKLYDSIEKYEKGEKIKRMRGRTETALLQNRFVDMLETIEKQQQDQRRIIASISHDIKTPLTSIMGYAELLKKDSISQERKERYLGIIYDKSTHIRDIIDDFDEYLSYNMESSLKKQRMPVDLMMAKLTESYDDELEHLGVNFIYNHTENNRIVDVDIQKMRRVFGNIISNSLKHFKSERKIIQVVCENEADDVKIIVSDNGEGVAPEKLQVVFEPLYTSDEGRKVAGLGLAICKEIVEGHAGTIKAERSAYGGLSIVIKLKTIHD
ncbi:MAG: HAMP domain-containing histidine kinase [Clostridia bacterium]|nr:HAMP domain-containing histidine kinase [Clostridia bacterium]